MSSYDKNLDKMYGKDIESAIVDFNKSVEYNRLIGEDKIKIYELKRNSKIDSIQNIIENF